MVTTWKPNIVQRIMGEVLFGDLWPAMVAKAEEIEKGVLIDLKGVKPEELKPLEFPEPKKVPCDGCGAEIEESDFFLEIHLCEECVKVALKWGADRWLAAGAPGAKRA